MGARGGGIPCIVIGEMTFVGAFVVMPGKTVIGDGCE